MSTPTTAEPDNLRSRLPDPSQFIPVALIAKPVPGQEPHYRK